MAKSGPETRLVNKMVRKARTLYGDRLVIVNNHGGMYSATGVADLTGCLDGIFWACEVKAPESYRVKGEPSIEKAVTVGPTVKQVMFLEKVAQASGHAAVCASVDQFMEFLANVGFYTEYRRRTTGYRRF